MADENQIIISLEGMQDDDGHVRLPAFLTQLQNLSAAISKIDKGITDGESSTYLRVVGLSHSSPATVVLEACRHYKRPDVRASVVKSLSNTIEHIYAGTTPDDVDYEVLEDLRNLAFPVGKRISSIRIAANDSQHELNQQFVEKVNAILAVEDICEGDIEGRLEQINIHDNANVFVIYPDFGPKKVKCYFPNKLLDLAVSAVNRRVSVSGTLRFRPNAAYPYAVNVVEIEPHPPESELPSFDDIRGLAPNILEGIPSEAFIRKLRDDWQ